MKFRFRGVRGSIAVPGSNTVIYGGNTTCIEIRTDEGKLIILDAGTGIHSLGQDLLSELPIVAHIFITHTHWDHIQGLPLFSPIFIPNTTLKVYGGPDPVTNKGIERALNIQFQHSYFPIREEELSANIEYNTIMAGQMVTVGNAEITPTILDHPVLNFGYRVNCDGHSLFFTGDFEPQLNIYDPEDKEYEAFQQAINEKQDNIIAAMQDVDVLIVDSSYTSTEYMTKHGWGHGTYESAMKFASLANAKKLFFTHHDPSRSDTELEQIYQNLLKKYPDIGFEIVLAKEGEEHFIT